MSCLCAQSIIGGPCITCQRINQMAGAQQQHNQAQNNQAQLINQANQAGFRQYQNVNDPDYWLFKQYAHLSDGELLQAFQDEIGTLKRDQQERLERFQTDQKTALEAHIKRFWDWCARFRKSLTPERADNLKAFT